MWLCLYIFPVSDGMTEREEAIIGGTDWVDNTTPHYFLMNKEPLFWGNSDYSLESNDAGSCHWQIYHSLGCVSLKQRKCTAVPNHIMCFKILTPAPIQAVWPMRLFLHYHKQFRLVQKAPGLGHASSTHVLDSLPPLLQREVVSTSPQVADRLPLNSLGSRQATWGQIFKFSAPSSSHCNTDSQMQHSAHWTLVWNSGPSYGC